VQLSCMSMRCPSLATLLPYLGTEKKNSFQATEENEMHLVEGELIEEIEKLDEGWWSGVGGNGVKTGLFPGGSEMGVLDGQLNILPTSKLRGRNSSSR
jgi:hypothetical protein